MKRRGFIKGLLTAFAVAPALTALEKKPEAMFKAHARTDADKWRDLCGYGRTSTFATGDNTLSCVAYDAFAEPMFKVGDRVMIGDKPHVITKVGPGTVSGEQS